MTKAILFIITLIGVCFGLAPHTSAQPSVSIACGADQTTGSSLPSIFPGIFYNLLSYPRREFVYRFERITSSGREEIVAPLTQEQILFVNNPTVSPDGRLMAFRPDPYDPDADLIIWDIETDAIQTLDITPDELANLNRSEDYSLQMKRFVWQGSSRIVIQYLDEYGYGVVAQTFIDVDVQEAPVPPLLLTRGNTETFDMSNFPVPADYTLYKRYYSPQHTYVVQEIGRVGDRRLEIIDAATHTQVFSSPSVLIPRDAVWSIDETSVVYSDGNAGEQQRLFQVDLNQNSTVNESLIEAVREELGANAIPLSHLIPTFSNDGQSLNFNVYSPDLENAYFVFHNLRTGMTNLVCNQLSLRVGDYLTFWLPGNRYFAVYQGFRTHVIDSETGDYYITPSLAYVGWAKGPNVPPVADA
ncbi:MAG: PD40 domain-containing protein, partial [Chitinophagaceae bacterium]|nr:PD40 domain-containing protein [Anaerolineae bacterium]